MAYTMANLLRSEKSILGKHATTDSTLQTPPRTPTVTATSAQALASEIRDIRHALSKLPDLAPGNEINALLTRLVQLCIVPYSEEFIAYFFGIEDVPMLCEQLTPLCATAEGELEKFWANNFIAQSIGFKGAFATKLTCLRRFTASAIKTLSV